MYILLYGTVYMGLGKSSKCTIFELQTQIQNRIAETFKPFFFITFQKNIM